MSLYQIINDKALK